MNTSKISVRYAKALFLSAKEADILLDVFEDMKLILSAFKVQGFKEYMESPVIKMSAKKELIRSALSENMSELSMNFYDLIITNNRENYLGSIIRNFFSLYRKEKGIKSAILKIPFSISDAYRVKFISMLENTFHSEIEMEESVDPEIIGGFILKVEDEQFDASIKTSLAKIKKKLLNTVLEK